MTAIPAGIAVVLGWVALESAPSPRQASRGAPGEVVLEKAVEPAFVVAAPATTSPRATPEPRLDVPATLESSSLRGSAVDGSVRFDGTGQVLPDVDLRRLFDYWLSLVGEHDPPRIRSLLAEWLRAQHGALRAQAVLDVFDRYVAYQAALARARLDGIADPAVRLRRIDTLRHDWLGRVLADAFFADERRLAAHTLQRQAIAADPVLDVATRRDMLAELEATLPPSLRESRQMADMAGRARALDDRLAATGARTAAVYAARAAEFGDEAATRLAALDAAEAAWTARLLAYASARDQLVAGGADASALAALRAAHFAGPELRRVESLESAGLLAAPGP